MSTFLFLLVVNSLLHTLSPFVFRQLVRRLYRTLTHSTSMYYSLRVLIDHILRNEQSGCVSFALAHSSRACWHVAAFLSPRLSGILDVFVFRLLLTLLSSLVV